MVDTRPEAVTVLVSPAKKSKNKTSTPCFPSPSITDFSLDFLRSVKEANKCLCKFWVMTCIIIWNLTNACDSDVKAVKHCTFLETSFSLHLSLFSRKENRRFLEVEWFPITCISLDRHDLMYVYMLKSMLLISLQQHT